MVISNIIGSYNNKWATFKGTNETKPVLSLINQNRMVDSFLKMTAIDTTSKDKTRSCPSSKGQKILASRLAEELNNLGLKDVNISKKGLVTAILPDNLGDIPNKPVICLMAHLDTSLKAPAANVVPIIHKKYSGGDIILKKDIKIDSKDLQKCTGNDIITTDGTTLLGADDKAGIAEILEALRIYKENPDIKHPTIKIAFTPDEEVSGFIPKFDTKDFGVTAAYTLDGEDADTLATSTFNSHKLTITISGVDTHAGYAKDKMINAIKLASELIVALPEKESPEHTEEWEGFYIPRSISGQNGKVKLNLSVADFDYNKSLERVKFIRNIAKQIELKHPGSKIRVVAKQKGHNMKPVLDKFPDVIQYALEGIKRTGLIPREIPIRGGTDGAHLAQKNPPIPTPDLGSGGHNWHSTKEFLSIQEMEKCTANIINILSVWAEKTIAASRKN